MFYDDRTAAFVLVATDHGMMIVNRMDFSQQGDGIIGVGVEMLQRSHYDKDQLELLCKLVEMRRETYGDGVICIDGGANIGAYTLSLSRMMTGWGQVLAFEPQERVFYALAGNLAINNCFNAKALQMGLGAENGVKQIERIDYRRPRNFGGVSLGRVDGPMDEVQIATVDSFALPRLDLLKLDIEGMELEALEGAQETIKRCKPMICAEHIFFKERELDIALERLDYEAHPSGMNVIAFHESDPVRERISWKAREAA